MAHFHLSKRLALSLILLVLAAIGLFGIIPQLNSFDNSLTSLRSARVWLVVYALIVIVISYALAATMYKLLALHRLAYTQTLIVQLAGLLINRLLPGGIGGVGLNFLYLRAHKHTAIQAGAVVSLNNGFGFVGHSVLAVAALTLLPSAATRSIGPNSPSGWLLIIGGLIVMAALLVISVRLSKKFWTALQEVARFYRNVPLRLIASLLVSCALTAMTVLCFWLCCQAVSVEVSLLVAFAVFTLGIAVGTVTPTPGGLGGQEAALTAGLIANDVVPADALAAVLLFRLITFWLGLLIGAFAALRMQSLQLLRRS